MKRRDFTGAIGRIGIASTLLPLIPRLAPSPKKIGLICPGSPINEEKYKTAIENCKLLGFEPYHTSRIHLKHGYLAGTDGERLNDLHEMFEDPSIELIWCIRGGYGCTRLLPKIDYRLIKRNPKPIIGYSDVTALLNTIHNKTQSPCYHGPVASSTLTPYTRSMLEPMAYSLSSSMKIQLAEQEDSPFYVIHSGHAEGELCGGNLSIVSAMAGTPYEIKSKNKIVFLEDVGEKPYRIDRMLTQLISSDFFKTVKGIILGEFADCDSHDDNSLTLKQVFNDRLKPLNIPTIYGFSFGHINDQCTLPIGGKTLLNTTEPSLILL